MIAVLLNIVLNLALNIKIASTNGAKALVSLGKWIMPIAGVVYLIPQVYSVLFPAKTMQDTYWYVFIGILFIVSGNYFPKNHINPYVGLKFPWLFNDEEGWYKTHQLYMDTGWYCQHSASAAQSYFCNRSANHFSGWRCPVGLFTCPLF